MYKQMYLKLFNAISDAVEALQRAQAEVERMFIEYGGDDADEDLD